MTLLHLVACACGRYNLTAENVTFSDPGIGVFHSYATCHVADLTYQRVIT